MSDEKPPTESPLVEAPKEDVQSEPRPEPIPEPTPQTQTQHDDMPSWAKALADRVDALSERISKPVEESAPEVIPDAQPIKEPWHTRKLRLW